MITRMTHKISSPSFSEQGFDRLCFVTSPQTLFGREVLFYSCESVILSVVLSFRDQDNSKSSRPISIKFGRTLSYIKNKVKLQYDKNCSGRTRTLSNRNFKISINQKVIGNFL